MMQDVPPPPPGFRIVSGGSGVPTPPPGFSVTAPARQSGRSRSTASSNNPRPAPADQINDLGITNAEEIQALMAQGYTREQAAAFVDDPGMFPAQPADLSDSRLEELSRPTYQQLSGLPRGGGAVSDIWNRPWRARQPEEIIPPAPTYTGEDGVQVVEVNAGITQNRDGTYSIPETMPDGSTAIFRVSPDEFALWQDARGVDRTRNSDIAERRADPRYQELYADSRARQDNIPALLENLSQGQTLGGIQHIKALSDYLAAPDGVRGIAYQAALDSGRDRQGDLLRSDPLGTIGAQLAGGLATPGVNAAGGWIGNAAGAQRLARAGIVGGAYGGIGGALNSNGDNLLSDTVGGAALGGATGIAGQRLFDRLAEAGAARAATVSPQRYLSSRGVDLTPGQMMGGAAQRIEEGLQSFPVFGDSIKSARARNLDTFNRAAVNEALRPLGTSVSGRGRDLIGQGRDALSSGYRFLDDLSWTPDEAFTADLNAALNPNNLSRNARTRLNDTVADVRQRLSGPVSGRDFKQIESELTGLIRSAENGAPEARALVAPLRATRQALRDSLQRQNPEASRDLGLANQAYANFERINRAAANPATARADGSFTPGNLNSALARAEGRNYARGEALLQDLSDAGVTVLGDKVPDSGTPLRSLLTMGVPSAGGLAVMGRSEIAAIGAVATGLGSLGYGQTAQRLLNAVYRRSGDGGLESVLSEISRVASRDPALQPLYQQLVQALVPDGGPPLADQSASQRPRSDSLQRVLSQ